MLSYLLSIIPTCLLLPGFRQTCSSLWSDDESAPEILEKYGGLRDSIRDRQRSCLYFRLFFSNDIFYSFGFDQHLCGPSGFTSEGRNAFLALQVGQYKSLSVQIIASTNHCLFKSLPVQITAHTNHCQYKSLPVQIIANTNHCLLNFATFNGYLTSMISAPNRLSTLIKSTGFPGEHQIFFDLP